MKWIKLDDGSDGMFVRPFGWVIVRRDRTFYMAFVFGGFVGHHVETKELAKSVAIDHVVTELTRCLAELREFGSDQLAATSTDEMQQ